MRFNKVIGRGMDFPDVSLVIQAGLPMDADSYTHRVGRTARAGKDGRAVIILTQAESFYLKVNPQFPIKRYPLSEEIVRNNEAAAAVSARMQEIDEDVKRKAYSAYLGFMKSFEKRLQTNSAGLVQIANELALKGMGCPEVPPMDRKTVGYTRLHSLCEIALADKGVPQEDAPQRGPRPTLSGVHRQPQWPSGGHASRPKSE